GPLNHAPPALVLRPCRPRLRSRALLRRCFSFQAGDGIRDRDVTGVQTCALPISSRRSETKRSRKTSNWRATGSLTMPTSTNRYRSEERRVGKEGRSRGGAGRQRKQRDSPRRAAGKSTDRRSSATGRAAARQENAG